MAIFLHILTTYSTCSDRNQNFDVDRGWHLSHPTTTSPDDIITNFHDRWARPVILAIFFTYFNYLFNLVRPQSKFRRWQRSTPVASDNYVSRRHFHQFSWPLSSTCNIGNFFLHILTTYSTWSDCKQNFDVDRGRLLSHPTTTSPDDIFTNFHDRWARPVILAFFLHILTTYSTWSDRNQNFDVDRGRHLSHPTTTSPERHFHQFSWPLSSTCNIGIFCLHILTTYSSWSDRNQNFDVDRGRHLSHPTTTSPDDIFTNFHDRWARPVILAIFLHILTTYSTRSDRNQNFDVDRGWHLSHPTTTSPDDIITNFHDRWARSVILAIFFLHILTTYSTWSERNQNFDVDRGRHLSHPTTTSPNDIFTNFHDRWARHVILAILFT